MDHDARVSILPTRSFSIPFSDIIGKKGVYLHGPDMFYERNPLHASDDLLYQHAMCCAARCVGILGPYKLTCNIYHDTARLSIWDRNAEF